MAKKAEEITEEIVEKEPKAKKGLYTQDKYVVRLPLSSEKQEDVTVGINGFYTKIQRGKEVEVTADVYEVLQNMERMDNLAIERRLAIESK